MSPEEQRDYNKKQLEIWENTLHYEIEMMAPRSIEACQGFIDRIDVFGKKLEAREAKGA